MKPFRDTISKNATNWCVVAAPAASWAARVFPGLPQDEQVARLSAAIARLCRLDAVDPVAAWQALEPRSAAPLQHRTHRLALTGRRAEFDRLCRTLDQVAAGEAVEVVSIIGEPGLGKSRLVAELERAADSRGVRCFRGRSIA